MIHPIVRMFATTAQAQAAVASVKGYGLDSAAVSLITSASAPAADGIVAAIAKAKVLKSDAKVYAQGVLAGKALVVVDAPFGTGSIYEDVLDAAGPVDSGVAEPYWESGWDDAAPFSSALSLPVISRPSPYLFMGLPALLRSGRTTCASLGLPELASSSLAVFGSPNLSRNPAPFSGLLHLPLLR
jgi:hypothetical protein